MTHLHCCCRLLQKNKSCTAIKTWKLKQQPHRLLHVPNLLLLALVFLQTFSFFAISYLSRVQKTHSTHSLDILLHTALMLMYFILIFLLNLVTAIWKPVCTRKHCMYFLRFCFLLNTVWLSVRTVKISVLFRLRFYFSLHLYYAHHKIWPSFPMTHYCLVHRCFVCLLCLLLENAEQAIRALWWVVKIKLRTFPWQSVIAREWAETGVRFFPSYSIFLIWSNERPTCYSKPWRLMLKYCN